MKRHATTLILLALAVALGIWLWGDRNKVTEGERKRRESDVFTAWRRDALSRIEIAHDGETLVLERDAKTESSWRMLAPHSERADQAAVERLTTTLEFARILRKAGGGTNLGFDAPRAVGSVSMGGLVQRFALGGLAPRPEGASYFSRDGLEPVVVSKELTQTLLQPSDTYRDRTVVPYLSLELARFEVIRPAGGFAFDRIDESTFRVASEGVLASREAQDKVWSTLAEMRAEAFPKDADADRLTASPELTIKMTPKDPSKPAGELVIGGVCPGHPDDVVVLRKAPSRVAACAPKGILDGLRASPASLVEKRPFFLRADEVEEIKLERIGGADGPAPRVIELARKGGGFHERAPIDHDLSEAEAEAASELLSRITSSQAETVTRGDSAPFTAIARARMRRGEHEQIIEIGGPIGDGSDARVVLRRAFDGARLEVSRAVVRRLLPRETSLRPRAFVPLEPRRVTRVVLRCGTPQELVDRGEGFRFVAPTGYDADGSIVQLVEGVVRAKVDTWVSDEREDPAFGLDGDTCHFVLGFEDGNKPLTVFLGAAGEGGVYGRTDASAGVFVAPRALRELAERIYVSRGSMRVPPSLIERVTVTRDGRRVAGLDAAALRDAASTLVADRVVAVGAPKLVRPDLVVEIAVAEAGARGMKRVSCGAGRNAGERFCAVDGVAATFAVPLSRLATFLGLRGDAGE